MGTLAEMLSTPLGVIEWFVYLLAAVMFVIGLHLMNSPKTARKGNMVSAIGMVFAVAMAFIVLFAGEASNGFKHGVAVIVLIVGIVIGAVAGVVSAKKVKMTDMPQLVSVFNTVGGGAAALVALNDILTSAETPSIVVLITAGLGIMIGSVTFSGSLIAAGKLQGIKWVKKLSLPGKGFWNILFVVLTIVSFVMLCVQPNQRLLWSILTTVFALCYGLVFVIPIGGADMPVVISVLNACTGTAVAMSGLAINNIALIVARARRCGGRDPVHRHVQGYEPSAAVRLGWWLRRLQFCGGRRRGAGGHHEGNLRRRSGRPARLRREGHLRAGLRSGPGPGPA